jgi:hypothetical protein
VYEKNFEKHLKKCNAVVKCLGKWENKILKLFQFLISNLFFLFITHNYTINCEEKEKEKGEEKKISNNP